MDLGFAFRGAGGDGRVSAIALEPVAGALSRSLGRGWPAQSLVLARTAHGLRSDSDRSGNERVHAGSSVALLATVASHHHAPHHSSPAGGPALSADVYVRRGRVAAARARRARVADSRDDARVRRWI